MKPVSDESETAGKAEAPEKSEPWSAERAAEAWKELLGINISPERIASHCAAIAKWLNEKPRTIAYMDETELSMVRQQIIDALLKQGTTLERANELVRSLPTVGDRLGLTPKDIIESPPTPEVCSSDDSVARMPFITATGELIVPFDCPAKYRWWQSGQSVEETLAELQNTAVSNR